MNDTDELEPTVASSNDNEHIRELAEQRAEALGYPKDGPWTVSVDMPHGGSATVSKGIQRAPMMYFEYPPTPHPINWLRWGIITASVVAFLAGGVWLFDYAQEQEIKEKEEEKARDMKRVARNTCFSIENAPLLSVPDALYEGLADTRLLGFPDVRLYAEMDDECPEVLAFLQALAAYGEE